ncbi:MAG: sugar kinase [Rhodobacterales bacterium CG_4_9_14_3_um_filter_71_31]|nr:MAG: sugar kinase [Rhodobacterales bacterium CG_4_9_14_3_um_filter_71_31]
MVSSILGKSIVESRAPRAAAGRGEKQPVASIACAGVVAADLVFAVPRLPDKPLKYRANASALVAGGCAVNAAAAVARLGGRAFLMGAVGDDAFGAMIRAEMAAEGVDCATLTVADAPTARSAVLSAADGERMLVNHRDPALFAATPTIPAPFPYDGALADTRWPAGAAALLTAARAAGRPGVLDAEAPTDVAAAALAAASHVAFSEQGLAAFTGLDDARAGLAEAAARLGKWVCVTRGPAPVLIHDGAAVSEAAAFAVTAVDTLGAGDVWHGAFALFLAEGLDPARAARRANAVAALKASAFGGRAALPDRARLESFMRERHAWA